MENNVVETNGKKNLIIGIMACVIILLIAALVYFLFIKKDSTQPENGGNNNQQEMTNNNEKEDVVYKPWMKYILEQNITKIELSQVSCSEDNFGKEKVITINTDQLKEIFNKFMNYKLQVSYTGGGGWECGETLKIKYLKDGKEYELEYLGNEGHVVPSSDGCATIYDKDLENALYNSSDIKDEEFRNQEGICVMYALLTPDNYLFDEYFK